MFEFLTCAKLYDESVDAVSAAVTDAVERDVGSVSDEIKIVNADLGYSPEGDGGDKKDLRSDAKKINLDQLKAFFAQTRAELEETELMGCEDGPVQLVTPPAEEVEVPVKEYKELLEHIAFVRDFLISYGQPEDLVANEISEIHRVWLDSHKTTIEAVVASITKPVVAPIQTRIVVRPRPDMGDLSEEVIEEITIPSPCLPDYRTVFPCLVAALVLDARARYGILPQTKANYLCIGNHMRKQCRNASLRVSAVDTHVAPALVQFFVPNGVDIVTQGMLRNSRVQEQWDRYDRVGLSWIEYLFSKRAPRQVDQV